MKPLIYLGVKSLVNGIKRAFTSARRLIGLIFVIGYYVLFFIRPFDPKPGGLERELGQADFPLPTLEGIELGVFALFAALTLFLGLGSAVQKVAFRPADVDVLFATPINPRIVLIFRLVRDYLVTLLMPLLIVVISYKPTTAGFNFFLSKLSDPGLAQRAMTFAWILIALTWVCIGYAMSLFVNRSDLVSDRNRRVITFGGIGLLLIAIGYIGFKGWQMSGWEGAGELARDPGLRTIFFTATAGTAIVMAPLRGEWMPILLGAGGLLALSALALCIALTQAEWMYDQAAARGFDSLKSRKLQQQGDMIGLMAERARRGKLRRKWAFLDRINASGPLALLWRETIVLSRAMLGLVLLFVALAVGLGVVAVVVAGEGKGSGIAFMVLETVIVFSTTMAMAQSGFIELLQRVDLSKPLPFTPGTIAFAEITAKAIPSLFGVALAAIVATSVNPSIWPYAIAAIVGLPCIATLFSASVFLVTVLFPDVDDPLQRGFRGLVTLLGIVILMAPVSLAFGGLMALLSNYSLGPVVASMIAGGMALAFALGIATIGGGLYASYNPSE